MESKETQPIPLSSAHQENPFEYRAIVFSMLETDRSHLEPNQGNMQGDLAVWSQVYQYGPVFKLIYYMGHCRDGEEMSLASVAIFVASLWESVDQAPENGDKFC